MTLRAQVLVLAIALSGLIAILWLVRRRSLKERFALLWLGIGAGMVVLVLARPVVDAIAASLGIQSGTSLLFLLSTLFLLGLILHLSIQLSRMETRLQAIAEQMALMSADESSPSADSDHSSPPTSRSTTRRSEPGT